MGKCIKIDSSWIDMLSLYTPTIRRYVYEAIIMYSYSREIIDMPDNAKIIFNIIKSQIDKRERKAYCISASMKERWADIKRNSTNSSTNSSTISKLIDDDKILADNQVINQNRFFNESLNNENTSNLLGELLVDDKISTDNQQDNQNSFLDNLLKKGLNNEDIQADVQKLRERTKENEQEKENFPPHPLYKEKEIDKENKKENTILIPPVVNTETARAIFLPPTISEVKEYCEKRKNGISPEQFVNFYQSKGWMIGKNKMKDWKAAVRTWEIQNRKNNGNNQTTDNSKFRDSKNVYETKSDF